MLLPLSSYLMSQRKWAPEILGSRSLKLALISSRAFETKARHLPSCSDGSPVAVKCCLCRAWMLALFYATSRKMLSFYSACILLKGSFEPPLFKKGCMQKEEEGKPLVQVDTHTLIICLVPPLSSQVHRSLPFLLHAEPHQSWGTALLLPHMHTAASIPSLCSPHKPRAPWQLSPPCTPQACCCFPFYLTAEYVLSR